MTFTNAGIIHLDPSEMFQEGRVLVHEYGHFVQESIGAYHMWPAHHDGCIAWVTDPAVLINSAEYAWFEGFADFFSDAVREYSADSFTERNPPNTVPAYQLPSPPCPALGKPGPAGVIGPDAIEMRVEDVLYLLMNDDGFFCGQPADTAAYRGCAAPIWEKNARLIMSIFDKELDADRPGPADVNRFAVAWLARGGDRAKLIAALKAVGITAPTTQPADPHAVCIKACNQALTACMATAHSGAERKACAEEGKECKAACPP